LELFFSSYCYQEYIKINGSALLINIIGGVALLLWGLRMVRTGIIDAWGNEVRSALGASLSNRFKAFFAGLGVTILLQSSSATALLTASFSGQGIISTGPALAVLLGADVGTTMVAQVLTFDLSALSPILIALGFGMFTVFAGGRKRDIGRLILGIGMMLLSLKLILDASMPMRESDIVQLIFSSLGNDLILAVIVAAVVAWLAHSGLATVLLIITLAGSDVLDPSVAFAFVLGANIGSAMPAVVGTLGANSTARQPPLGNLIFRICGVAIVLPMVVVIAPWLAQSDASIARQIANFHMFFNIGLAIIFLPLINQMATLTQKILPEEEENSDQVRPMYLDKSAFDTPLVALVNAEREVLRMGEVVEHMFRNTFVALKKNDVELAKSTREMDHVVNQFYNEIKFYLISLSREPLGEKQSKRCNEIMAYTTSLEYIGDIISNEMIRGLLRNKLVTGAKMSLKDREDINELYQPVLQSFNLSLSVFSSDDIAMARQLLVKKYKIIKLEKQEIVSHLNNLREDITYDPNLSALQLDVIRDLKRINWHLSALAYPILEEAGMLRSRFRSKKKTEAIAD
jgi:phosphate:Na+ symporter